MSAKDYLNVFSKSSGKGRLMFALVLFAGVGLIAYVLGGSSGELEKTKIVVANDTSGVEPSDISGVIKNKEHQELLKKSEFNRVKEAKVGGHSSVAPITGLEDNLLTTKPEKKAVAGQQVNKVAAQAAATARQQQIDAINSIIAEMKDAEYASINGAVENILKVTQIKTHKVYSYNKGSSSELILSNSQNGDVASIDSIASKTSEKTKTEKPPRILVGSIIPAVLEMKANSDSPTPLRARIIEGPLKGAILIGKFTSFEEGLVIEFNLLTKNGKVADIDVVAIDPSVSSASIATDVNHHYIYRYGMLMGATFVSGVSDAVINSGTTVSVSPLGTATTSTPVLNVNKQLWAGVGEVGARFAKVAEKEFDKPNTVIVDRGTLLGIMFVKSARQEWLPFIKPDK